MKIVDLKHRNIVIILMLIVVITGNFFCACQMASETSSEKNKDELAQFDLSKLNSLKKIYPVVVIGSGPAGLTASMYTSRAKFKTLVITGDEVGGQLIEASYVENFPTQPKMSGLTLMDYLKAQTQKFGTELFATKVISVKTNVWPFQIELANGDVIEAITIIIATGGSQRTLNIPGVKEFWGKGIGVCSICDAPFDQDKEVAIIGGGDAAADRALQLSAYAKQVTLLVRGPVMRAAAVVQDYINNAKNIRILFNVEVKKINGKERVEGVEIVDTKTGKASVLPVESVYFAMGFVPRSDLFKGQLALDKEGYIQLSNGQATSVKGIFAAGTVEDSRYQKSATAAGNGSKAGMDAIEFLQNIGFNPDIAQALKKNYYKIPKDD